MITDDPKDMETKLTQYVILTIADDHMDTETFRLHVLHAAESLALAQPS